MNVDVLVIDYGMGNLRSVHNKFIRMGIECNVSNRIEDILKAKKLILPGVGHFNYGMNNLKQLGLIPVLNHKVMIEKIPILGICLGTQLFCNYSEEGDCVGLGWIDAKVVKFNVSDKLKYKVPHMGWNNVKVINSTYLDKCLIDDNQFYFVHSYHIECKNPSDRWMTSVYDYEFTAALHNGNIYGTQFHPEKSHEAGYELLKRFAFL